jgi:hypothetical protein
MSLHKMRTVLGLPRNTQLHLVSQVPSPSHNAPIVGYLVVDWSLAFRQDAGVQHGGICLSVGFVFDGP